MNPDTHPATESIISQGDGSGSGPAPSQQPDYVVAGNLEAHGLTPEDAAAAAISQNQMPAPTDPTDQSVMSLHQRVKALEERLEAALAPVGADFPIAGPYVARLPGLFSDVERLVTWADEKVHPILKRIEAWTKETNAV